MHARSLYRPLVLATSLARSPAWRPSRVRLWLFQVLWALPQPRLQVPKPRLLVNKPGLGGLEHRLGNPRLKLKVSKPRLGSPKPWFRGLENRLGV